MAGEKKRQKRNISDGIVHIYAADNNTIINFTDVQGNTICWASTGSSGFSGSRKRTPYSATVAAEKAALAAIELVGLKNVEVRVAGAGPGRESAIRALHSAGLKVQKMADVTPVPYNGCRPPKKPRI